MNNYTVYIHVAPNGKRYVGLTCQKPEQRWANGKGYNKNKLFHRAINKYGWDAFEHIIIATGLSKDQACNLEKALISGCNTTDFQYGYNISIGGDSGTNGVKFGLEFGEKVRSRMLGCNNINYCKKFSKETLNKLSAARKGKWSEKQREALTKVHESMKKKVVCLNTLAIYESLTSAAKKYGIPVRGIEAVCRGEQISSHGLYWAYYTGQSEEELNNLFCELIYKKRMVYKIRNSKEEE